MTEPSELKGEELLDYYREAVRACYGDDIAEESELYCERGWYWPKIAQRFPDGSVGVLGLTPGCRAAQVREMADELLELANEEAPDA